MATIEEMIGSLNALSAIDKRTAALAAPRIEEALKKSAAAGMSPDGEAWAPAKKTGKPTMVNAAKAISTKAFGNVIRTTLTGPEVFHQYGVRGEPRRKVIPDTNTTPDIVADALDEASAQAFEELTGTR